MGDKQVRIRDLDPELVRLEFMAAWRELPGEVREGIGVAVELQGGLGAAWSLADGRLRIAWGGVVVLDVPVSRVLLRERRLDA